MDTRDILLMLMRGTLVSFALVAAEFILWWDMPHPITFGSSASGEAVLAQDRGPVIFPQICILCVFLVLCILGFIYWRLRSDPDPVVDADDAWAQTMNSPEVEAMARKLAEQRGYTEYLE